MPAQFRPSVNPSSTHTLLRYLSACACLPGTKDTQNVSLKGSFKNLQKGKERRRRKSRKKFMPQFCPWVDLCSFSGLQGGQWFCWLFYSFEPQCPCPDLQGDVWNPTHRCRRTDAGGANGSLVCCCLKPHVKFAVSVPLPSGCV